MAFSRNGWPNPLGILPRSEIQNVSYRLRQQQLERLSFDQQDPLTGSQPTVRVLLREVTAFRLRFYADGRWQETWTALDAAAGAGDHPDLANSGEITRLFLLTPGAASEKSATRRRAPDGAVHPRPDDDPRQRHDRAEHRGHVSTHRRDPR
jgi:general secretion pathway protein J